MQEIVLGAALFTGIVIVLAVLILLARSRLVPGGGVTITINGERKIAVAAGGKLLNALTAHALYLPSACGGSGTCGQCKVKILEGGGGLLPTEASLISKHEAAAGLRLACQVGVSQDMRIEVPEDVFGVNRWACTVRSNANVATYIKELICTLPEGETMAFRAGGYVQIECPVHRLSYRDFEIPDQYRADWERYHLFDLESVVEKPAVRAYSMANYPDENTIVSKAMKAATANAESDRRLAI